MKPGPGRLLADERRRRVALTRPQILLMLDSISAESRGRALTAHGPERNALRVLVALGLCEAASVPTVVVTAAGRVALEMLAQRTETP